MKKLVLALVAAGSISVGACATTDEYGYRDDGGAMEGDRRLEGAGQGAVVGGALGAGAGALIGGINPIEGAVIGAVVGGLAGAVWADKNNDGYADGYMREGQYYEGEPEPEAYEPEPVPAYAPPPPPVRYAPPPPPVRRRSGERG
ncbi:MAG TPA: YMGG-like glycine zipper-containing protein [Allosphingosinicella sp.]